VDDLESAEEWPKLTVDDAAQDMARREQALKDAEEEDREEEAASSAKSRSAVAERTRQHFLKRQK
jgi:hypothetical protein